MQGTFFFGVAKCCEAVAERFIPHQDFVGKKFGFCSGDTAKRKQSMRFTKGRRSRTRWGSGVAENPRGGRIGKTVGFPGVRDPSPAAKTSEVPTLLRD